MASRKEICEINKKNQNLEEWCIRIRNGSKQLLNEEEKWL